MKMMLGILIGLVIGFIFNLWIMYSYKKVLIMKAQDGSAEYIYGKFYYIKEEGK
jgi:hypothetical protein